MVRNLATPLDANNADTLDDTEAFGEKGKECVHLLKHPYFTMDDINFCLEILKRSGHEPNDARFSFDKRADLSGTPYQLLVYIN